MLFSFGCLGWGNPEQVMVAEVSYGLFPMCEIPKGVMMGHSTM
jgi:hypothetical protein